MTWTREAHNFAYMLGVIVIFGFLLRNVWLTLFLIFCVFSYTYYGFNIGKVYLSNIFYGCVLYYLTKLSFKRKNVDTFITAFMWIIAINCIYMVLQICNLDFIYEAKPWNESGGFGLINWQTPGFLGHKAFMGVIMALAVPVFASRVTKHSYLIAGLLFVPIYLSKASTCFISAIIGLLFILWHRISRKLWIGIVAVLIIAGMAYLKLDMKSQTVFYRAKAWRNILMDAKIHPITGWGLDSFRNITKNKKHLYIRYYTPENNFLKWWDNAHNIYVQMAFEFGLLPFLLLLGYFRSIVMRFRKCVKEPNTLALTGFILVFFLVSFAHFPMYLARFAVILVPMFALMEVQLEV